METIAIEVKIADGLYEGFRVKSEDAEQIRQQLLEIWLDVQIVEHVFWGKFDTGFIWTYDDIVRYLSKH